MKILLVNANRFKQPWPVIPFGMCCVAAAVEEAGHDVKVLDLCFSRHPARDIKRTIGSLRPDVVGLSVRNIDNGVAYNALFLLDEVRDEVVAPCKEVFSGPIVIGGPSVGINAAEMLDFFGLEFAIRGDGELALVEFLRRLQTGQSPAGLQGLVWRREGRIVQDSDPLRVENLDSLPAVRPSRYLDLRPYRRFGSPLQMQTKRGCALRCAYCTYNAIEGRRARLRDPGRVADEIEALVKETGIRHVEFTDSTFNIPLDHAKAVLRALAAKGLDLNLRTMGLNPGAVDQELVDLMKVAGFRDVDLGVEAAADRTLESLGKNFRKEAVLEAGRLLREAGIPTTWYLLLGAPGETEETLRETFDTINRAASPWDLVNIAVGLRVYKGSPIADLMLSAAPELKRDNFLHPVSLPDEALDLESLKEIVKSEALSRTNYFMYDEDEKTPPLVLMLGTSLLRLFAPRQPIWRLFIVLRLLQRASGVNFLKRWLWRRRIARRRAVS